MGTDLCRTGRPGVLLDLNTLLARDQAFAAELKSDSIGALYETFTFNGGQYAFPEQWSGNFLFYNKQLFDDAGVPPPPGSWERPWSFAEFLDAAQALTKQGRSGRDRQWGFVNAWVSFYAAGLFAMNNGVPWSVPRMNPTHLNFDHDGFLEAVQFYADLTNKHKVAPALLSSSRCRRRTCFLWARPGSRWPGTGDIRRSTVPTVWTSTSPHCPSVRADEPPVQISVSPGWPLRRPVDAGPGVGIRKVRDRPGGAGIDRRIPPVRAGAEIGDQLARIRQRPPQGRQSCRAQRGAGLFGRLAGDPGLGEDRRPDGPLLRTRAAWIPAGDLADRAITGRR